MEIKKQKIIDVLLKEGLRVTPQRIAVLEGAFNLKNHPTTENIIDLIKKNDPHIATGTIYKTLETLVVKGILKKMPTEKEVIRYETVNKRHHHLYCTESGRIEDFYDDELNVIIDNYLAGKKIPGFKIEEIKIQIVGRFNDGHQVNNLKKIKKQITKDKRHKSPF